MNSSGKFYPVRSDVSGQFNIRFLSALGEITDIPNTETYSEADMNKMLNCLQMGYNLRMNETRAVYRRVVQGYLQCF